MVVLYGYTPAKLAIVSCPWILNEFCDYLVETLKKIKQGLACFFKGLEANPPPPHRFFYSPTPPYAADPMQVIWTLIVVYMISMGQAALGRVVS